MRHKKADSAVLAVALVLFGSFLGKFAQFQGERSTTLYSDNSTRLQRPKKFGALLN